MTPKKNAIITITLITLLLFTSFYSQPTQVMAADDAYGGSINVTKFNKEMEVVFKGSIINTFPNQSIGLKYFVINFTEILPKDANREPYSIEKKDPIEKEHRLLKQYQGYSHVFKTKVQIISANFYLSIYFEWVQGTQLNNPAAKIHKAYCLINATVEVVDLPTSTKVILYMLGFIFGIFIIYVLIVMRKAVRK